MRLIFEPTVRVIGRQVVDETALASLLSDNDASGWETDTEVGAEKLVEVAGRLCYMSFAKPRPGGNKAYTNHILEVGHGSVLEHAVYNLIFEGVSRSLSHELVRHRAGMGYSQLSQRFVDESDCGFVVPPGLQDDVNRATEFYWTYRHDRDFDDYTDAYQRCSVAADAPPEAKAITTGLRWLSTLEVLMDSYEHFSSYLQAKPSHIPDATARRKAAREAARSVLPNCTETKIFVTGNARALRHFIEMRGDAAADAEIRRLALATLKALQAESSNLFGDYVLNHVNGQDCVSTPYTKV